MKTIKSFTDRELIDELRNRNYVMDIWQTVDVDNAIAEAIENNPEEFYGLELSDDDKMEILRDLFEDNDKSDDNDMIYEKVIDKFNELKKQ